MAAKPTPAVDRVLARIVVNGDCWEWQGALNHGGYGIIQMGRGIGTDRVHRVMYRERVGPIPEGGTIDHLCANPRCCNPAHLEQVSRAENARRQWADGRGNPNQKNKAKTHCKRGHPLSGPNLDFRNGRRHCRACRNLLKRERRRAKREGTGA